MRTIVDVVAVAIWLNEILIRYKIHTLVTIYSKFQELLLKVAELLLDISFAVSPTRRLDLPTTLLYVLNEQKYG